MVTGGPQEAVMETSVLVNFLAIDRLDLLAAHPYYHFTITNHVRGEITAHYPEQLGRFEPALAASWITVTTVDSLNATFVSLASDGRLGVGECATIAYAIDKTVPVAIDDKQARKAARRLCPTIVLENTESLMVGLVKGAILNVASADGIKEDWEKYYRFKLPFGSFADKV